MGLPDETAKADPIEAVAYARRNVHPERPAEVLEMPSHVSEKETQKSLVPQASHLLRHILVIHVRVLRPEVRDAVTFILRRP